MLSAQHTVLSSEIRSLDGRVAMPMPGCSGPAVLIWFKPPAYGVSFLVGIRRPDEVAS